MCQSSECRLAEEQVIQHIITTDSTITRGRALALLKTWFLSTEEQALLEPSWPGQRAWGQRSSLQS